MPSYMMQRFRPLAIITLFVAVSAPGLAQSGDSLIRANDLFKIKQLETPSISPDGKHIVYTIRTIEERPDRPGDYGYRAQLWIVATDGKSGARQLTRGEAMATSPAWSPSGDRVAFVRRDKEKNQIWILPLGPGGGEPFPLTKLPTGAFHPGWSPDGQSILFVSSLSLSEARNEAEKLKPLPKLPWTWERPGRDFSDTANYGSEKTEAKEAPPKAGWLAKADGPLPARREWLAENEAEANPRVLSRLDFLGEAALQTQESINQLFVVKAEEGAAPLCLTPGYRSVDDPHWVSTPEGPKIVFTRQPEGTEHPDRIVGRDLWIMKADGTAPTLLLRESQYSFIDPVPSPDGKTLAFLATDESKKGYDQTQIGIVPIAGGEKKLLTGKLDRVARSPKWSLDGKFIYFTAASTGGFPLYRVPANGGTVERLTTPAEGIRDFDLSERDAVIIVTKAANPYEMYRVNPAGKDFRLLTAHNSEWLRTKTLSAPQRREVSAKDGTKIEYWLMRPTFFENGKYPLIVCIHGGPSAMWGPGEATMWHEFQYFTSRGYGVVYCNPRGSGGYGYQFQHGNYRNWGPGPGADVLSVVDAVTKEPWVDSERLVITGGSYGGYLTAWIIGQDHRFKAAAALRGVYDLSTFFGEGNAWRLVPYHFGGLPWEAETRKLLFDQSPLSRAHEIRTPLLIKHGDTDFRTGVVQSELLYKALKYLGKPVEYVRYPRGTHELSRSGEPRHRIDRLVRIDEFFQRFIGKVEKPSKK